MAEKRMSDEIRKYGYVFSMKKSVALYTFSVLAVLCLGKLYSLSMVCQIILGTCALILLPFFIRNSQRNVYNQRRFSDLNIYMEQFLYSFRKTGKVLATLKDVRQLFEEGQMRETIDQAIDHIRNTYNEKEIEKNALSIVETAYPYSGLRTIHGFALDVEKYGGSYDTSLELLLEARRMWADRNFNLLKQKKHQRTRVILSILTTLLICTMVYYLSMRLGVNVGTSPAAQIVTLIVLAADLLIFYLADRKFSQDDAICDGSDQDDVLLAEERIEKYRDDRPFDRIAKRAAVRKVTRQLEKDFPQWLMQVSLLLQTENVQVAIFRSYETAPASMKRELGKLIVALKKDPASMKPYVDFLSDYTLPEARSAMKMLYSLSEGTGGAASQQIGDLVRRNEKMLDRAEVLKSEDALAGMYALFLAPQITGGLKLLVDMVLLFLIYMAGMGQGMA